jgi:hypothetical protein
MSKRELENLAKIGKLKAESGTRAEFDGLAGSARKRLADAQNENLSAESRFDLAYNAAHASLYLPYATVDFIGIRSKSYPGRAG